MEILVKKRDIFITILIDFMAILFIYFLPALAHFSHLPIYYADPMRIALFSVLIITKKENVYIMALTIPLLSFLISGHPVFPKCILVSLELFINVVLIYQLSKHIKNLFITVFASLMISKSFYYLIKFALIKLSLLESGLISTPILYSSHCNDCTVVFIGHYFGKKP